MVSFGSVSGKDESIKKLRQLCSKCENMKIVNDETVLCHTIFELPEAFDKFFDNISKSKKKHYRQGVKRLKKSFETTFLVVSDSEKILDEFEKFAQLHSKQWKHENKLGHFLDWPSALCFHRDLVKSFSKTNRVRITKMSTDNKDVAMQYSYFFGDRNHWFLPAREPGQEWNRFELGIVTFMQLVEVSIGEGITCIDGGQGHYDYKLKLGAREYPLQSILITGGAFQKRFKTKLFLWFSSSLHVVYYKIWFCRLAPKFPFIFRRSLWKLWIRTRV